MPRMPVTSVGNPDLRPETGKAYSLGLVWTVAAFPGSRVSVDYWQLHENNRIAIPGVAAIIAFPDVFPGRVPLDPVSGAITGIINAPSNFGSLRAEGLDVACAWQFLTSRVKFTPSADWGL